MTDLPCHIENFQSAIHVSLAVLKHKTDADIKEGIIIYMFPMFTFTNYYETSPPSREVVENSMSYLLNFCNYHKLCISVSVYSLNPY